MIKTATVRVHIDQDLKSEVDALLRRQGISATEAIHLFYQQIRRRKRLPFRARVPNAVTRKVFKQTERGIGLKSFKTKEALFADLGLR